MGGFFAPGQSYPGSAGLGPATYLLDVADVGAAISDSIRLAQNIQRTISTTGLTLSDTAVPVRTKPRTTSDTAITLTDVILTHPGRAWGLVDLGLNMADVVRVQLGHTIPVQAPQPDVVDTEKLERMLRDLQPELTEDPIILATLRALALELQRVENAADAVRRGFFPAWSDDRYGILELWEQFFRLPVAASGLSLDQRRQLVEAHFQKRIAGKGTDWEDALKKAMGTTEFTYQEGPLPYTITIRYPFGPGAPNSQVVQGFAREITPAHESVLATYTQGFLVGISLVGDPL